MEKTSQNKFSQRHPLIFGFMLIIAAVVIFMMAMAVFNFLFLEDRSRFRTGEKIGVVNISGLITDSREIVDWINELKRNESVKGVVLRINSPGGVVGPSQEVYAAVQDLARTRTVVASMGAMAASGGYYVASPAHQIVANPGTLTASIGVKATLTNMQELMRKIGIQDQAIYSGEFKDAGTVMRPMTDREKEYFQALIDDMHDQFVQDVAQGRNMALEEVIALADGRAMTGRQAYQTGLVDVLGGMNEALELLRELTGIKESAGLLEGPVQKVSLVRRILGEFSLTPDFAGPRWIFTYE
ncbi:signal peptide peptidase SppA [Desulfonatronovibrio hydrogenovorans]|uniref:signal peptide peptidase SppA n=1 Tax=Desulfonatronovibrio hydrogenovorans TaxID=53245 RepID=UPI0005589DDA|nr:signal peptide peptidase SppA [Desulfonatronovibrio hydrogenovorans]